MATIVDTRTTPAGTPYSVYEEANGVDTVQWQVGDAFKTKPNLPATMYCHGSTGSYNQGDTITALNGQRYGVIDNGGVFAQCGGSTTSIFNGQNHQGRDFAKTAYSQAGQIVGSRLSIGSWAPWGRSMGDLVAKYLATQDPYMAPLTAGYISMSGLYSMMDEFDGQGTPGAVRPDGTPGFVKGNHFDFPHWYGTTEPPGWDNGDSDTWMNPDKTSSAFLAARTELFNKTATNDPARYAQSLWAGKKVLVVYGTADTTVVPFINSLKFWNDNNSVFDSATKTLVPVAGATHSQTGGTYDSPAVLDFLKQLWGISTPTFKPGYKSLYRLMQKSDGTFRKLTYIDHG